MPLGREVDDIAGRMHLTRLVDEHAARLHSALLAFRLVRLEVIGEPTLELQRETTSHDADAVDGIDQGFAVLREDIADFVFDHGCLSHRQ